MKEVSVNSVSGGLVTDLSEDVIKNTVLTKAENVDIVTTTDNNFILQKRDGTQVVMNGDDVVQIPMSVPLAVKELNNVAYIVSINDDEGKLEIGTFPSPDWDNIVLKDLNKPSGSAAIINTEYTIDISKDTAVYYEYTASLSSYYGDTPLSYRVRDIEYIYISNTGINSDTYTLSMDTNDSWKFGDNISNNLVTTVTITVPSGTSVFVPIVCNTAVTYSATDTTPTVLTTVSIESAGGAATQTVTLGVLNIGITYWAGATLVQQASIDSTTTVDITLKVTLGMSPDYYAEGNTDDSDNDIVIYAIDGGSGVPYKTEVIYSDTSQYLYKIQTYEYSNLEGISINACKQIYDCNTTPYYLKIAVPNFDTQDPWVIVYYRNGQVGDTKVELIEFNTPTTADGGAV